MHWDHSCPKKISPQSRPPSLKLWRDKRRSQSEVYFIRIPERGNSDKGHTLCKCNGYNCQPCPDGFFGEGLFDSYFLPLRGKYEININFAPFASLESEPTSP